MPAQAEGVLVAAGRLRQRPRDNDRIDNEAPGWDELRRSWIGRRIPPRLR